MDWLTDNKIPVGKWAKAVFDWLQDNGRWFFDGLSDAMEALIDALLWIFQTPHPLIVVAAFVGLTWFLQRSWKTCAMVAVGIRSPRGPACGKLPAAATNAPAT